MESVFEGRETNYTAHYVGGPYDGESERRFWPGVPMRRIHLLAEDDTVLSYDRGSYDAREDGEYHYKFVGKRR